MSDYEAAKNIANLMQVYGKNFRLDLVVQKLATRGRFVDLHVAYRQIPSCLNALFTVSGSKHFNLSRFATLSFVKGLVLFILIDSVVIHRRRKAINLR